MIRVLIAVFVALKALIACVPEDVAKSGIFNEVVAQADRQRTDELARVRVELKLADGSVVSNCTDYLVRGASVSIDESLESQLAKSEYLICEALDLIERSRAPAVVVKTDYGQRLADLLDLRSFPSSLNMRSDDVVHTLSTITVEKLTVDAVSVAMDEPDWHYRLEVVAVRDINGNDTPDWIVWLADEAKQGSYRGYVTLVLLDPMSGSEFAASPYLLKR